LRSQIRLLKRVLPMLRIANWHTSCSSCARFKTRARPTRSARRPGRDVRRRRGDWRRPANNSLSTTHGCARATRDCAGIVQR
jgi:hypothetical protein